jgi:CRP-like cAMP-binding protein
VTASQPQDQRADPRANTILGTLPDEDFQRLAMRLEAVNLPRGTVLEDPHNPIDWVYFPVAGVASMVALGTGQMPVRTIVQVHLSAYRLPSFPLRTELERGARLVNLLQRYTQVVMVSMAQLILCNRVHRLDQRAARWLLQVDERVDEAPFDVTQEFLAEMIGTQRPSVSLAVSQFKDAGLIK